MNTGQLGSEEGSSLAAWGTRMTSRRGGVDSGLEVWEYSALAGVAQWTECRPTNQRVAGWIPSQGTCLGCRPVPNRGHSV